MLAKKEKVSFPGAGWDLVTLHRMALVSRLLIGTGLTQHVMVVVESQLRDMGQSCCSLSKPVHLQDYDS